MENTQVRTTIGFFFTILFFSIVAIATWFALSQIKNESLKNVKESLYTVNKTTTESLTIWTEHQKSNILELISNDKIIDLTKQLIIDYNKNKDVMNNSTQKELRKIMKKKLENLSYQGYFIIAPNRISIASLRDSNIGTINLIHKDRKKYLDRVFNGETLFIPTIKSDVLLRNSSNHLKPKLPTMFIASPVFDSSKNIIAVLTVRLNPLKDFTRITQLGSIGNSGETYAFDDKGLLITESRFTDQLKKIGMLSPNGQGILAIRISDPGGNMNEGFVPTIPMEKRPLTLMIKNALSGDTNHNIEGYRNYAGVEVIGSWTWDKYLGIGIGTEISLKEALHTYINTRNTIITVLALTVVLLFTLLLLLLKLEKRSKYILKKAYAELEGKVEERTITIKESEEKLTKLNKELERLCFLDGLTGVSNRSFFDNKLTDEWAHAKRDKQPISLIIIDIDFFKKYNTYYGHQKGDNCLVNIAVAIFPIFKRKLDVVARYGGEEFVALLPDTHEKDALILAEKCKNKITKLQIPHESSDISEIITVSIGVATITPDFSTNKDALLKMADELLSKAKGTGRNKIISLS